jgi:hypothetical protein
MAHVGGQVVNVLIDGIVQPNQTVAAGGTVTLPRASTTSYEVGLPISVVVKTMPLEIRMQSGPRLGFKKRIVEVNALLYKTQNIAINGNLVPIRTFDTVGTLDSSVPEFTGTKVLNGILGYSNDAQITVTQTAPLKFTLLGLEYKIATHQGT